MAQDTQEVMHFGVVDFVVFIGMFAVSLFVGIYYAIIDRKKKNVENYYFGGRSMSPIPVGLSMAVTFISAITVIGFPAETYSYGMVVIWFGFMFFLPNTVACIYYIPLIHRLRLTSIYEILELRFNKAIRQVASLISVFTMLFYMGTTIYVPGLALSAVTPLSLTSTILLTSIICTVYTTVGGLKAVVWTDTIQTCAMVIGAVAALIKTTMLVGGFDNIWAAMERGGRLNAWNFDFNPTVRYTIWSFFLGQAIGNCSIACIDQSVSQRYLSCKSVKQARIASFVATIPKLGIVTIAVVSGAAMYTYYETCDPLLSHKVEKPDQMMPYLVVEVFRDLPGMAGLFVAAGFSATLSTVSSGINALAALILEDFILPCKPHMSEKIKVTISKVLVFGFGLAVMCIAFLVSILDATIVRTGTIFNNSLKGPLLGIFTLALFFPWTNIKGAIIGQVVGTTFSLWIAMGNLLNGKNNPANRALPASIEGCPAVNLINSTYMQTTSSPYYGMSTLEETTTESQGASLDTTLYAISFLYYGPLATLVTIVAGLIGSFATGANKPRDADPELFLPLIDNRLLPEKVRKFFRFGVPTSKPAANGHAEKREFGGDFSVVGNGHAPETDDLL